MIDAIVDHGHGSFDEEDGKFVAVITKEVNVSDANVWVISSLMMVVEFYEESIVDLCDDEAMIFQQAASEILTESNVGRLLQNTIYTNNYFFTTSIGFTKAI